MAQLDLRRKFFLTFLIFVGFSFLLLSILAKSTPYFKIDLTVSNLIQGINFYCFDILMYAISDLGGSTWGAVLITIASVYVYFLKRAKDAGMVVISGIGASLLADFIKRVISRPRPDSELINQLLPFTKNDSFPSGHVLLFVGIFGFLIYITYLHLYKGLLRTFLLFTFSLMILLIGVSRIYLGVHWFSDVLGSYLIGIIWLYLVIYTSRKLNNFKRT